MKNRMAIAIMLIVTLVTALVPCTVMADNETIFEQRFEDDINGVSIQRGTMTIGDAPDGNKALSFNVSSGDHANAVVRTAAMRDGIYKLAFDYYTTNTSHQVYLRILNESYDYSSDKSFVIMILNNGVVMTNRSNNGNNPDPDLDVAYSANVWNKFEIWVDAINREIETYINNSLVAELALPDGFDFTGISIFDYRSDNGGYDYWDNISIVKEETTSGRFSPVCIKAVAPDEIYGNNFYKDNPVRFNLTLTNRLSKTVDTELYFRMLNSDGAEVWKSESEELSLSANETKESFVKAGDEYFGRMVLEAVTVIDGKEYIEKIPYTMSNHTSDMPNNKDCGIDGHLYAGRGDFDKSIGLINGAGIGTLRDSVALWPDVEKTKGKLVFTEEMDRRLDLIEDSDIFFINLFANGNGTVYPNPFIDINGDGANDDASWYFPVTSEGIAALQNYIKEFTDFANGRVDVIEVWNEWHNMSGPYENDVTHYTNMCRAIYNGVRASNEKWPEVAAFSEDMWGHYFADYSIPAMLKDMNGEVMFDSITLHPYHVYADDMSISITEKAPEYTADVWRGVIKRLSDDVNAMVKQYYPQYSGSTHFTEMGYTTVDLEGDLGLHAAYLTRMQALTQAEKAAETACSYSLYDNSYYMRDNKREGNFGMLESPDVFGSDLPGIGKPAYVATAYYNGLVAEAQSFEFDKLDNSTYFAYDIVDRNGRDVLMIGTKDNSEKSVSLSVGAKQFTVSDMYGNEKKIYAPNGEVELELCGEPTYIIGQNLNPEIIGAVSDSDIMVAIVKGNSVSDTIGEATGLYVLNDGYSLGDISTETVMSAVYYQDQATTDSCGQFEFAIPIKATAGDKTAYVNCGDGSVRVFKIKNFGNCIITYEEQAQKNICISAATLNDSIGMVGVEYTEDGILENVKYPTQRIKMGNLNVFEFRHKMDGTTRAFFWENLKTLKPYMRPLEL